MDYSPDGLQARRYEIDNRLFEFSTTDII